MKGWPVGTLCELTKTYEGLNVGLVVRVLGPAEYISLETRPGVIHEAQWIQPIETVTFAVGCDSDTDYYHKTEWMRPIQDNKQESEHNATNKTATTRQG